jgi:hypothetical protein
MTEKEAIIKLFKIKMTQCKPYVHCDHGTFWDGCSFYNEKSDDISEDESYERNFIGISSDRVRADMCFNNIVIELEDNEYYELRNLYDAFKQKYDLSQEEIERKKLLKDMKLLSLLASKETLDSSRRVLNEKHTKNTKFKF